MNIDSWSIVVPSLVCYTAVLGFAIFYSRLQPAFGIFHNHTSSDPAVL